MNYTVYFVVKNWLSIDVKAETQEKAVEIAKKRINGYPKGIDCVDGSIEFAGIMLNDVTKGIGG